MGARQGSLFTNMLHGWVNQARQHPHSLASCLRDYETAVLATRLQCEEHTVCWLQLYGRPDRCRWEEEVQRIATDLELDWRLLDALLRDAVSAQPTPMAGSGPTDDAAGRTPAGS